MIEKKKTINRVILNNYKVEENTKREGTEKEIENNSFNQLQSLQLLIQKHSGLKELCK